MNWNASHRKFKRELARSPQMQALLDRYGVDTEQRLRWAVRAEYKRETDTVLRIREVNVILDQMLEAEYQRQAGA